MKIPVSSIKVKKRVRKDFGDIEGLMASMEKLGLITPVTINEKHELIAGGRRLEAARRLGWTEIEAVILRNRDKAAMLEMELEENLQRAGFTEEELEQGYAALKKLRNPGHLRKLVRNIKRLFSFISLSDEHSSRPEKLARAKKIILVCMPVCIITAAAGSVLASEKIITPILHWTMDAAAALFFAAGITALVRYLFLKR